LDATLMALPPAAPQSSCGRSFCGIANLGCSRSERFAECGVHGCTVRSREVRNSQDWLFHVRGYWTAWHARCILSPQLPTAPGAIHGTRRSRHHQPL
jgi:hypothetical protein